MPINRDTLPVLSGAQIETIRLEPSGIHIPTTVMRGVTGDGSVVDLLLEGDGRLRAQVEGQAFDAASEPGARMAVGTSTSELLPPTNRVYLSIANPEGPGDVFLLLADSGSALLNAGVWVPYGGVWEMPQAARWTGGIQAIASANSHVAVAEY